MQAFIIIGLLGAGIIWLSRDKKEESVGIWIVKRIVTVALAGCMLVYYFAYIEEDPEYKLTCSRCGEVFVEDDPNARRVCSACFSALMEEQLDQVLEEDVSDYDGKYSRTATCSKCGKKYLERKGITSKSEDAPKLCEDCDPAPSDEELEKWAQTGRQEFLNGIEDSSGR